MAILGLSAWVELSGMWRALEFHVQKYGFVQLCLIIGSKMCKLNILYRFVLWGFSGHFLLI